MRIECPACAAAYEVPDHLLTQGSGLVRCARCGHDWEAVPVAAAPPPSAEAVADPEDAAEEEDAGFFGGSPPAPEPEPVPAPSARAAALLWLGWAGSLGLLAAAGWWAVAQRDLLVSAWPPAGRIFAALGLA
jgi:predicted Zn finger-like uncharacterized protein